MKSIISKTMMMVAIAATISSFTIFGGEGFEIYLNNKVVVKQFGKTIDAVNSLRLDQSSAKSQLTVKYYHCGEVGRNRIITVKDAQNNTLREWRFADAAASVASPVSMNCNVKDILNLDNGNESTLKLYYSSNQLPKGRLLTNIVLENNGVARNK